MASSKITQARIDEVNAAYEVHGTFAETSRHVKMSPATVKKIVTGQREADPEIDETKIVDTYREHATMAATRAMLPEYTEKQIRRVLIKNGVDTSRPGHDEDKVVQAFIENDRNLTATTQALNISMIVLKRILTKNKMDLPTSGGRVTYREPVDLPLPQAGEIKRYILTSAQNNTPVHEEFFRNLETAAEFFNAELMVARYTYNKGSYANAKSVKVGHQPTADDIAACWYDEKLEPYFCDGVDKPERYRLAPGLVWCSEMNILPTASSPLTSLEGYTRRESGIFPHASLAMESVASLKHEATKFNYTTGTVTQRNYIQKLVGLKAEFFHSYSALLVEIDETGAWWVRQLEADQDGVFYDLDVRFQDGAAVSGFAPAAVNWGDVHASEADPEALLLAEDILDTLRPEKQFMHDLLSFRSRSHHEMKNFGSMYEKYVNGQDSVDEENRETARVANQLNRDFCEMLIVNSNHDRHGEKWLDEADFKKDYLNAEHYLEAMLSRIRAIKAGTPWQYSEWALKRSSLDEDIRFLEPDQSYALMGVEFNLHGDLGPNGARGSTRNLAKLGRKVNKGHDHKATIYKDVFSAGACQLNFGYMSGPSGHSISHILTYPNGSRSIVTCWNGQWRAEE